ncbi:MAG: two component transcriptional regulator, winged helix family [Chloroflexi bacterium]|nr:two component transcriptional regulator, winged helix family [Chloroflexota bacterium]
MRILLVEDEARIASFIRRGMEEEQHAVDVACDGDEGLHLAEVNPYDVLVLDIMLPRLNGIEVCRLLRAHGNATPILMLTARDSTEDVVAGLDAGADDYLTKPFAFAVLLARLRALQRRQSLDKRPVRHVGDLELDPTTREVRRGGQVIDLSNREYALLEYLLERPGRVLTRAMIGERCWDMSFDTESNVIDVYVGYLRRKLEVPGQPRLIHTVRGVGYVLRES